MEALKAIEAAFGEGNTSMAARVHTVIDYYNHGQGTEAQDRAVVAEWVIAGRRLLGDRFEDGPIPPDRLDGDLVKEVARAIEAVDARNSYD